jgi:hypothetical protein
MRFFRHFLMILMVSALLSSLVFAANTNARIMGTVIDPQNAVVAGAQITATNTATGVVYATVTGTNGTYLFAELPIGSYMIKATAQGFKTFTATGIVLNIDQEYVQPVRFEIGAVSQVVQVSATPVQVDTTDMEFSNVVDSTQMTELPLINRAFTGLELALPGVQANSDRFGSVYSVNGSQTQQSEYLINGADTNDIALNTIVVNPILDAIDQFNMIDGPMNAEYDRNSGGIISASIKQGSNAFHGDAFEFYRDTFLNTNNFFQKSLSLGPKTPVSPFHQNIWGGTLGGRIFKDKLFFFGAYQGTHQAVPEVTNASVNVYSSANLNGDFSDDIAGTGPGGAANAFSANYIPSTISIPNCTSYSASGPGDTWASCMAKTGGKVPTTAFNSVVAALVKKYLPPANSGTYGYLFNATTTTKQFQVDYRIDYNINPKNQLSVIGIYLPLTSSETLPFGGTSGATVPGFSDSNIEHIQQYTVDYVRQFNPTAVNDFGIHWTRMNYKADYPNQIVQPSSVGFGIAPQDTSASTVPQLNVSGFYVLGGTGNGPQPRIDQTYQLEDNFSKTWGSHALKFGYDGHRFNVSNLFDASNSGVYSFNNAGSTYSTGDPSLDLLLGIPASYSQGTGDEIQADAYLDYFYAQDTWKLAHNLTINYGLGYSLDTPLRNHQFGGLAVSCFIIGEQSKVFPGSPTDLDYPGDPGCTNSGLATTHYGEFAPRLGFAWSPVLGKLTGGAGNFSIRGGFGIYYDRSEEESALQTLGTPPFGFTSGGAADFGGSPSLVNPFVDINGGLATSATGGAGTASESNRFPYTEPTAGAKIDFSQYEPIYNISGFANTFRAPYAENMQLSIERQMPSNIVARVSWVNSLGRRNQTAYEANYETTAGQAACVASTTCQANRNIQALVYPSHTIGGSALIIEQGVVGSEGSSNYNALQASVTKGQTHGLMFQLSYTYGHGLDNASSLENTGWGNSGQRGFNQFQPKLNYGDSLNDARHRVVFSPVYAVPFRSTGGTYSVPNLLISGWQISGIVTLATGLPYDISYAGGTSRSLWCSASLSFYACPDIPMQTAALVTGNPRVRNANGYGMLFSPSSFAAEPIGSFGNIHRDPYHGPGINNTNFILAKNFALDSEGVRHLQIRLESDNVFNHTQFGNPTSSYTSGNFGLITSAASARQTQLAAKLYF